MIRRDEAEKMEIVHLVEHSNLSVKRTLEELNMPRHRVILPLSSVHRGSLYVLNYARSISDDVTAVHVSIDPADAEKVRKKWDLWSAGTRLVILDSPYRYWWSRYWNILIRSIKRASPMK